VTYKKILRALAVVKAAMATAPRNRGIMHETSGSF
jgi:hypothetical protein